MELNSIKSSIVSILKCPICYEDFSKKHEPMIIPCGHTICVNCVIQIIKLSEEEYDSYSSSSEENEYENFFDSDHRDSPRESRSANSNENSAQEVSEESEDTSNEDQSDEDTVNLEFELEDNINNFNFECNWEIEDNKKNFFMGDDAKRDGDGKLIKFKCSLCRKKMKINSKQIIKNIQLSELIKSIDQLHGTSQYLGEEKEKAKFENSLIREIIYKDETQNSIFEGKIFCNLCKEIFDYKEHIIINNIQEFHKHNFLKIDSNLICELINIFDLNNENNHDEDVNEKSKIYEKYKNLSEMKNNLNFLNNEEKGNIKNIFENSENFSRILLEKFQNEKKFFVNLLNKKFEKIIFNKIEEEFKKKEDIKHNDDTQNFINNKNVSFQLRLKEMLIRFLILSLNFGLSKYNEIHLENEFDFFDKRNQSNIFLEKYNNSDIKNHEDYFISRNINLNKSIFFNDLCSFVEAFSNYKKCKHKSFMELSSIYISFEDLLENKKFSNAEKILKKANKLLETFFNIFNKLKVNFTLYLKGEIIFNTEKQNLLYNKIQKEYINSYLISLNNNKQNNNYNINFINAKNYQIKNEIFYINENFQTRIKTLCKRKSAELFWRCTRQGFFSTILKNTILSEKRYSVSINTEFNSKSRIYLFDNLIGENVFCLNYDKIILTTLQDFENGNIPTYYRDRNDVYTPNVVPDEAGLNIYFIGSDGNSNFFRVYSLSKKLLIELPNLPEEYYSVDTLFHNDKLFILGGSNVRENAILNCYFFNVIQKKWFNMPKLNISRFNKCAFITNNSIYVYGGQPGYNGNNRDSWSSENNSNINSGYNVFLTQLWKFEVLDLETLTYHQYGVENLNIKNVTWKVIEISGFNQKLMEFGYGLIDKSKLILLGGIQDENEYYYNRGFIIDLEERKLVETLKIDYDIDNHNMTCNFYRGTFQVFLGANDDKVIKYERNFQNLNVFM